MAAQPRGRFAGVWCAELRGKRFTEISLADTWPVSGTMRSGVVRTDEAGNITAVEAEVGRPLAIERVRVDGPTLRFSTRDEGEEADEYELRITERSRAELTVLSLPLRPIALRRMPNWGLA